MKILLHACCAPCSAPIIEHLINNNIECAIYYFNPNIYPIEEYAHRRDELQNHCQKLNVKFYEQEYNHQEFLDAISGNENEPERGSRCQICFNLRMKYTAKFALENGYDTFCTSLSSSRWKSLEQIDKAGNLAIQGIENLTYLAKNWRKNGMQNRRNELLKLYNFYNQQYCGCEFSIRNKE